MARSQAGYQDYSVCETMASSLPLLLLILCCLGVAQSKLKVFSLRARGLDGDVVGTTEAYVKVLRGSTSLGQTSPSKGDKNPWWNEEFSDFGAKENDTLWLEVHDRDVFDDDELGVCQRQIKKGTYEHSCSLDKGGTLYYSYTLD